MCSCPKLTEVPVRGDAGGWWDPINYKFLSPGQTPTRTIPGSPQFADFVDSWPTWMQHMMSFIIHYCCRCDNGGGRSSRSSLTGSPVPNFAWACIKNRQSQIPQSSSLWSGMWGLFHYIHNLIKRSSICVDELQNWPLQAKTKVGLNSVLRISTCSICRSYDVNGSGQSRSCTCIHEVRSLLGMLSMLFVFTWLVQNTSKKPVYFSGVPTGSNRFT